ELGGRLAEGTAVVTLVAKPFLHHIEYRQEALARSPGEFRHTPDEPFAPFGIASAQRGHDELVLRLEVVVERHLGDAGFGKDGVNTRGAIAVAREQPQRGVYKLIALPPDRFVRFLRHLK